MNTTSWLLVGTQLFWFAAPGDCRLRRTVGVLLASATLYFGAAVVLLAAN
jgi:hypothetical protein